MLRLALALALLALPLAHAGTAQDPELTDGTRDTSTPASGLYADIAAAWVEASGTEIAFHLQLAQLSAVPPRTAYWLFFDAGGTTYNVAAAHSDDGIFYHYGTWNRERDRPEGSPQEAKGSVMTGSPALITIRIPRAGIPSDAPAIEGLEARTLDFAVAPTVLDGAEGGRPYALSSGDAGQDEDDPAQGASQPAQGGGQGGGSPEGSSAVPVPVLAALVAATIAARVARRR